MAVAQGECPNCGAPIEFGVGSSLAKICEYCSATVVRSDRGLEHIGQVAALANTPSLIAVGDEGTLDGRPFRVLGRVQLNHGTGPWDEYYVTFEHGRAWAWLAYAEGHFSVTERAAETVTLPFERIELERKIELGGKPFYVAERKVARVVSAEGELPAVIRPGQQHRYADLHGAGSTCATIDWGDGTGSPEVYTGRVVPEPALRVTALGPRSTERIETEAMRCPNCGGDVPALNPGRAERLGCPYCGAVSDIATQTILAQQQAAVSVLAIPLGRRGTLLGIPVVCIGYLRRSTDFQGERYTWEEFLLWNNRVGYRWLVKDPEEGWLWSEPVAVSDVSRSGQGPGSVPTSVTYQGRRMGLRNTGEARVDYVLGELYWRCQVGETTETADYAGYSTTLSREEAPGEVHWSASRKVSWPSIAAAFGLDPGGAGSHFAGGGGSSKGCLQWAIIIVVVFIILFVVGSVLAGLVAGTGGGGYSGGYRGGGVYFGGK